jgi:Oligopeptide/dipeptide transporter, C-terminal region
VAIRRPTITTNGQSDRTAERALLAEPAGRLVPQDQIALSFDPDARLDPVEGQPPDLTRLDAGCSFRPRRRFAIAACDARPTLEPAGDPAHFAACFRSSEIAAGTVTEVRTPELTSGLTVP